jgi:hypothetical protein
MRLSAPIILILLILLITVPVQATSLNFQQGSDMNYVNSSWGTSPLVWIESTNGGNSYVSVPAKTTYNSYLINKAGYPTQYAGATCYNDNANGVYIWLYDASGTRIGPEYFSSYPARYEVTIIGGTPNIYKNGLLVTSGSYMATNPYFIGFGAGGFSNSQWDDFTYGETESKYIFGLPETNVYEIKKDMISPANQGVAFIDNGTVVSANTLTGTWARSTIGSNASQTIILRNKNNQIAYLNTTTGNASYGTVSWSLTDFFNSGAPYGIYEMTILGSGAVSNEIMYLADGAEIAFDKSSYNQNDIAYLTYTINGLYWDTSTYTYSLKIYRANDWTVVQSTGLTTSTGTGSYTFTSSDTQGAYYAVIVATPNVGGNEIWMVFDYAQMNAYFVPYGWVNDAETGNVISGANVSMSQGSIISNSITTAYGNYTSTGFLTGSTLIINVTAVAHSQYYATLIPLTTGSKFINISLNSTSPTFSGLGIGGVHRDGILTGNFITSGYGRPIAGATAHSKNTTYGEYCTNVSNNAGWYKFDENNGCILTKNRLYDVWSEKIGYANSPNYTVVP